MQDAIMIRVTAEDYPTWIAEHDGCREARLDYGITDGPVYRYQGDDSIVLLTLHVEDFERARGWFRDERFTSAVARAGKVDRQVYFATAQR